MAMTSKQRQWARRVSEFGRSGLSRRAWCAAHGVNLSTLDYWRGRVRDIALSAPASGFARKGSGGAAGPSQALAVVPLRVVASRAPHVATAHPAPGEEIVLDVAAVRVRLPRSIDAPWLAALLRELR